VNFDRILRKILAELTQEKGYFALHADELSHLTYDIQFYLFSKYRPVQSKEQYLKDYPTMIAFGNREISTGGYAPGFIESWFDERISKNEITEHTDTTLRFSIDYEKDLLNKIQRHDESV
jgi:hypothetical protein